MKKLSELESPVLAGVIREGNAMAAIGEIKNSMYGGAGMIDLHMSCLEDRSVETLRKIISASRLPVLALNYNQALDLSSAGLTEEERIQNFYDAVEAGAAGVDIQGYTFDIASKDGFVGEDKYSFTKGNPKEIVTDPEVISKQCDMIDRVHHKGAQVLLSCHTGIPMKAEALVELALFLEQRSPDIIKFVTIAQNEDDLIESFRAMSLLRREVKTKVSYHTGGQAGILSRIINPILGGHVIFGVDRYNENSTMEQIDLRTARAIIDNIKRLGGL